MFVLSSKKIALIAFIFTAALAIPYAPDHIDSPIITQDRGSDLKTCRRCGAIIESIVKD